MKRAICKANKAQQEYQDAARALGCVVCRYRIKHGMQPRAQAGATQIHHRTLDDKHGQLQLGQDKVVSMCGWHHKGELIEGKSTVRMREIYGPSLAAHARDFRAWTADVLPGHGRGTEAWQSYQDEILNRGK